MTARGGHNRGRVSSLKPRTVMSSIMRARNGLTGPGEVSEVIGGSLPSSGLLDLRCSGSDAPTVTRYRTSLGQNTLTLIVAPCRASGFVHPNRKQPLALGGWNHQLSKPRQASRRPETLRPSTCLPSP